MNLSATALIVILTGVFGAGGLLVAIINAAVGRGGRRADVAAKITEAAGGIIERLEHDLERLDDVKAQCDKCQTRLELTERRLYSSEESEKHMKAAIRALIRVMEDGNRDHILEAITEARKMI